MKRWIASLATTLATPLTGRGAQATASGGATVLELCVPVLPSSSRISRHLVQSLSMRGGADIEGTTPTSICHVKRRLSTRGGSDIEGATPTSSSPVYETLSDPAPGSPFHHAFPVHDLHLAKDFYGNVLGCKEGRSSEKWQDYSLHGHQIVCHWVGNDYRCQDYYNPVDGDEVPVPHFGLALTVGEFHELAKRLREAGVEFIIEPHLRFKGMPGEQYTMFFKDPSGNNLEFKAMARPEKLFAKYNVVDV